MNPILKKKKHFFNPRNKSCSLSCDQDMKNPWKIESLISERERRILHEQLSLPLNKPIFRRGNHYVCASGGRLTNPHEAISAQPAKADVQVALVRGRYAYYHYMQDNFNDDGWGCAYRSMQTIFSWFR